MRFIFLKSSTGPCFFSHVWNPTEKKLGLAAPSVGKKKAGKSSTLCQFWELVTYAFTMGKQINHLVYVFAPKQKWLFPEFSRKVCGEYQRARISYWKQRTEIEDTEQRRSKYSLMSRFALGNSASNTDIVCDLTECYEKHISPGIGAPEWIYNNETGNWCCKNQDSGKFIQGSV